VFWLFAKIFILLWTANFLPKYYLLPHIFVHLVIRFNDEIFQNSVNAVLSQSGAAIARLIDAKMLFILQLILEY